MKRYQLQSVLVAILCIGMVAVGIIELIRNQIAFGVVLIVLSLVVIGLALRAFSKLRRG